MKQCKIAEFEHVSFGADFKGGALESLSIMGWTADGKALSAEEALELRDWLCEITGYYRTTTVPVAAYSAPAAPAVVVADLPPVTVPRTMVMAPNAGSIDDRVAGPLALLPPGTPIPFQGEAAAAEVRAHPVIVKDTPAVPVEKLLKANGMELMDMSGQLPPTKVTFRAK